MRPSAPGTTRLRVMHVASGGFSGATQVALDLTRQAQRHDCLLVLRQKRRTPMARVQALQQAGVPVVLVPGRTHLGTIIALMRLCHEWRPDVVVGHGFPEHLIARWAALGMSRSMHPPRAVQVEHNMRERYSAFKRWQVGQLMDHTAAFVGVSDAVSTVLRGMGLPPQRVHTIPNGITLEAFENSESKPWASRESAILMAARFGAQKDHETLIRALVPLHQVHGMRPQLRLAGGGSARHRQRAQQLVDHLGLQSQVEFLGHRSDLPALLMQHRVAALSTHYEGLPLILAEAMAAGCAVVGSDVPAVRETLGNGQWGWLARHGDAAHWAAVLAAVLRGEDSADRSTDGAPGDSTGAATETPHAPAEHRVTARVDAARAHARAYLNVQRMVRAHEDLQARLFHEPDFDEVAAVEAAAVEADAVEPDSPLRLQQTHPAEAPAPWLSVLMPAHNAAAYVGEALHSILSQIGPDAELVVLDDGSTDDTAQCIAALHHPQMRCLRHEQAQGVSAARNALLEAARGTWLWFVDADDRLRPGAVARVRQVIEQGVMPNVMPNVGLDVVLVDHAILRTPPRLKHRLRGEAHRESFAGPSGQWLNRTELMTGTLARSQWHPWGRVIRREAWPQALRFAPGRCFEDLALIPQLMAHCRAGWWIREPLVEYRSNPGSILGSMNPRKVQDWALALSDLALHRPVDTPIRPWQDHLAAQLVRMATVAQRLGVPPDHWQRWVQDVIRREPGLLPVIRAWTRQPSRWGLALKARALGPQALAGDITHR